MRITTGPRRILAALLSLTLAATLVVLHADIAAAAPQTRTLPIELKGTQPTISLFDTGTQVCDDCYPDFLNGFVPTALGIRAALKLDVTYDAPTSTKLEYNDSLLRQGTPLDLQDTLTMQPGTIHAKWRFIFNTGVFVKDQNGNWNAFVDLSGIPDFVIDQDFPCTMPLDGSADCSPAAVFTLPIVGVPIIPGILSIDLAFQVNATMSVNSQGVVTVRKADVIGGQPGTLDQDIDFTTPSPSTVADPLAVPCDEPAGNDVSYALTDPSYPMNAEMGMGFSLNVVASYPGGTANIDTLWQTTVASAPLDPVTLHGPDASTLLGTLGADNLPPTADAGSPLYAGAEGSPISFNGNASSDNCGMPTLKWEFSDGGVAFGPNPMHTFADNGLYTALLTATDVAGNHSSVLTNIVVTNQAPTANAGPDTAAAWGESVPFGGAGTDPGSADQASLTYSWDFGDGSPSAAGGPNTVHSYATPNLYTATLTVCDKNGGCGTDTRTVDVRRRNVTVSLTGPSSGIYATPGSVKASVVDEFGSAVQGRTVTFAIDGTTVGTAATNSNGVATLSYSPLVDAGAHTLSASVVQDSLYTGPASASGPFAVAVKATSVTYTGALTGAPNKVITLSATLVDATGTPLSGRTISFTLGTQTASAVTDANGKAATTLKLTQKNGTYTVTAAFAPAGADALHYSGNSSNATFKLQAK